jgi:broad specificity phosphatase PhoE
MATTILLVRHGQTEWNRIERFRGQIDIELNTTGQEQARRTAQKIYKHWAPVAIFSSPLKRAAHTANAIAQLFDLPVQPYQGLIDINYGDCQGLTPDEVNENWPIQLTNWYKMPAKAIIPGGESLAQVQERALAALSLIIKEHSKHTVVLVSHTVVNRLILLGILGLDIDRFWQLRQEPYTINLFEVENQRYTLFSMNDTCHLED